MNMSQTKGTVNLLNVKDLKVKMAGGSVVNLRGRLHTSRAKGERGFSSADSHNNEATCGAVCNLSYWTLGHWDVRGFSATDPLGDPLRDHGMLSALCPRRLSCASVGNLPPTCLCGGGGG